MRGKKAVEVKELSCGDIGAIGKLEKVKTGDTLCDARKVFFMPPHPLPRALLLRGHRAQDPGAGGQDRPGPGPPERGGPDLHLGEQRRDPPDGPQRHRRHADGCAGVQAEEPLQCGGGAEGPRVAYREKIRKTVSKQGRHKKQTGGAGQFGDVWVRFEPNPESDQMVFAEEVFGGSVPKNYFPAVEKGLREACVHGPLAGYPVVNLKAVLYDGSYHPVDSSEIAFKTAAQLAYKAAMPEANPVLMEPIGELKVTIPDSYMGDVIGDLNKRRGRIMGMNPTKDGEQVVEAEVPMAEMSTYAIDLRAMTQSRGSFTFHFVRYEDCPPAAQQKAIEEAKALAEE